VSDWQCGEYRELASAFVDEQLEGEDLLRLEAHLQVCPECRTLEGELRRFGGLLRAAEAVRPLRRPPPGFAMTVARRAAELPAARTVPFPEARTIARIPRGQGLGLAAAAAAAALFFLWSWQRLLPGDAPDRRAAVRPVPATVTAAGAEEGSMDAWVREHAMLARAGTLLGPAEEIEFASFHAGAVQER
jgi:anti-sigma factor RsiW